MRGLVVVFLSAMVVEYYKRFVFYCYLFKLMYKTPHFICLVHITIKYVGESINNYNVSGLCC